MSLLGGKFRVLTGREMGKGGRDAKQRSGLEASSFVES